MPKGRQKSSQAGPRSSQAGPRSSQAGPSQQNESDDEAHTTATQAQKAASAIPREDMEKKVNDLVQYLLVMDQKKIPIKRQDINKNVMKEHSKALPAAMAEAKEKLSKIFGFDVVELEGKQQKSYILVNKHEVEGTELYTSHSDSEQQRMGLLMVILSAIFMNNNVINDNALYSMLKHLGVDIERQHSAFGDVKKLLTQEFVRQGYLEMNRQPASEPPTFEFRWGQRAKHELSKMKCLQFVTRVYQMDNPSSWTSQWADVQRSEGDAVNGHTSNT